MKNYSNEPDGRYEGARHNSRKIFIATQKSPKLFGCEDDVKSEARHSSCEPRPREGSPQPPSSSKKMKSFYKNEIHRIIESIYTPSRASSHQHSTLKKANSQSQLKAPQPSSKPETREGPKRYSSSLGHYPERSQKKRLKGSTAKGEKPQIYIQATPGGLVGKGRFFNGTSKAAKHPLSLLDMQYPTKAVAAAKKKHSLYEPPTAPLAAAPVDNLKHIYSPVALVSQYATAKATGKTVGGVPATTTAAGISFQHSQRSSKGGKKKNLSLINIKPPLSSAQNKRAKN